LGSTGGAQVLTGESGSQNVEARQGSESAHVGRALHVGETRSKDAPRVIIDLAEEINVVSSEAETLLQSTYSGEQPANLQIAPNRRPTSLGHCMRSGRNRRYVHGDK
jgi:hypothetical protein